MATYETSELEVRVKFTAGLDADKDAPKITYDNITVVYADVCDAVKSAARFTTWTLQRLAREGKLPSDREIRVNSKCEFEKTLAEKFADLTDAEVEEIAKLAVERKAAKSAAAKSAKKA